jgi:adenylate cyclase
MTAAMSCRTCGTELLQSARFCHECGSPSAHAEAPAEYKQVTVLFADVVHSMDLASRLDAERLREVITELFNRSSATVQRYGGTVDKFTGDGIMAVFGAPAALEDHARRACLAALDIQAEASRLGAEVERRDGVRLQLRIGLNSGEVIAGEIGSSPTSYTAIGAQVGMAQRMESVAPAGGVMLSESTARLVEQDAVLGETEMLSVKGSDVPVSTRSLLAVAAHRRSDRAEPAFVGRTWELTALSGILDQAINGKGSVVGVVGPAGIGKSRIVRETVALAKRRGVDVFTTYCESHTSELPFHAAAGLLRVAMGITGLDDAAARTRVRARLVGADSEDVALLDDFLGTADANAALPQIDPDARRRRLMAMLNAASMARTTPVVYVIEDVHWVDEISEAMLAEFLAVAPRTRSLVLLTYRPDYVGRLAHTPRSQTIALEPLDDAQIAVLSSELLGDDPSITDLAGVIANRAAGNPFFAEEIVRDLVERNVIAGRRGHYVCNEPVADVSVPATLQAAIAARIDRLNPAAKRTLCAAAVVGSQFSPDVLEGLQIDPTLDELVAAELVDQVVFTSHAEYAFRHPLIRTVAYESQLKSERAQLHRRVAATIEPDDQNAALIAEHLEAAGDLPAAYLWHMRAGTWSANRDYPAARASWLRARQVADRLPADHPDRTSMRIQPRTLLCGSAYRSVVGLADADFDELRELCSAAGDKAALATGMAGLVGAHVLNNRIREASQLASEYMTLLESIGDPALTIGLSFAAIIAKIQRGELDDVLRWSQTVIDLVADDPVKGNIFAGSPLTGALAWRGVARWGLGLPGWREDFDRAEAMAQDTDQISRAVVYAFTYGLAIPRGVLSVNERVTRNIDTALQAAERANDDLTLVLLRFSLGLVLAHGEGAGRQRGLDMLAELRELCLTQRYAVNLVNGIDAYTARQKAVAGDVDAALEQLRTLADEVLEAEYFWTYEGIAAALVETLLERNGDNDAAEAEIEIDRMAGLPDRISPVWRDITGLRLRALLARARGDEAGYRDFRDRYHAMAVSLGFEGHIAMARAMT